MNLFDPTKAKKKKKKKVTTEKSAKTGDKENIQEETKIAEGERIKFEAPFTYDQMLERIKAILTKQNPNLVSSTLPNIYLR